RVGWMEEMRHSGKGSAALLVLGNLGERGRLDGTPPLLPAAPAEHAPLQVDAQEAQLVGSRQEPVTDKAGVETGEVLDASAPRQPPVQRQAHEVDQPRFVEQWGICRRQQGPGTV